MARRIGCFGCSGKEKFLARGGSGVAPRVADYAYVLEGGRVALQSEAREVRGTAVRGASYCEIFALFKTFSAFLRFYVRSERICWAALNPACVLLRCVSRDYRA
jgi:hypothetical protein